MPIAGRKSFPLVGFTLLSALLLLSVFAYNVYATVEFTQAHSFGAVAQARSMCQSNDGGYILVGQTQATSSSPTQALIVRTNSASGMLWNRTYGGTNGSMLLAVAQTADLGFAVAGTLNVTSEKFWLFKIDASGNLLWEQTYGGTYDEELYAMTQTNDGGYVLSGWTTSFGLGTQADLWMVKTDGNGTAQWSRRYGTTTGNDCGYAVIQTSDGGYALAGQTNTHYCWLIKTDSSGLMLWNKTFGGDLLTTYGQKMVQTSDLGYAVCGYANLIPSAPNDFYLLKTDSSGNLQWNKTYGGAGQEFGRAIVKSNDGGYVLAGYTETNSSGARDAWLVKTDSNGNMQWNQTLGGSAADVANSVVRTSDGGYAIAGSTDSYGPTRSFFLAKVDIYGPAPAPTFALATNSTTVTLSQSINLTGTLSLPKSGVVTLDWSTNSSGFVFHTNESLTNGVFSRTFGFGQTGIWQFRVNWLGDATSNPMTSNTVTVTVNPNVIPEFPTTVMLSLLVGFALLLAIVGKKIANPNAAIPRVCRL